MCHNKKEGDHSYSTLGEDAIVTRKMPEESANFIYLVGFLCQKPTH